MDVHLNKTAWTLMERCAQSSYYTGQRQKQVSFDVRDNVLLLTLVPYARCVGAATCEMFLKYSRARVSMTTNNLPVPFVPRILPRTALCANANYIALRFGHSLLVPRSCAQRATPHYRPDGDHFVRWYEFSGVSHQKSQRQFAFCLRQPRVPLSTMPVPTLSEH